MKNNRRKASFIILIIIALLLILLFLILALILVLKKSTNLEENQVNIEYSSNAIPRNKTVQHIIEEYGSIFIKREKNVFIETYIESKYDLFDEDGKSRKQYFYDMIDDIAEIEKKTFYLIDSNKNIKIYVAYDEEKETYKIQINDVEDFYNETSGENYVNVKKAEVAKQTDLRITTPILLSVLDNNMYYAGTKFAEEEREELENGYYSYRDETMIAKLGGGRILNIVLKKGFDEEITDDYYVGDSLEAVYEKYNNLAFGGIDEGYLGYRTNYAYIFIYEDEVSIYAQQYVENKEFDKYLTDYCKTRNLQKLFEDFRYNWGNYFECEYNPELKKLKIVYPTRGIDIDIENNDSRGIKIYNNYYLTDTVKELIKSNKITLIVDQDLVYNAEQTRIKNIK